MEETMVLFVFITNAVSDIFTFTAGIAEGQCELGISLEVYLKANQFSARELSRITQYMSFKA